MHLLTSWRSALTRTRRLGVSSAAIVLLAGTVDGSAAAAQTPPETVVVSNYDQVDDRPPDRGVLTGGQMHQSFCTGDDPVTLTKVMLATWTNLPQPTPQVTIRADASGAPGDTLHTLTNPAGYYNLNADADSDSWPLNDTEFTTSGYDLAMNTKYWVVVSIPDDSWGLNVGQTTIAGDTSAEAGWSIGGHGWRMRMALYATGTSPPDSPTAPFYTDRNCDGVADPKTLTVDEHAAAGTVVGSVAPMNHDNDALVHTLSGTDLAAFNEDFSFDAATGQITVKDDAVIEYDRFDTQRRTYSLTVSVTDSEDGSGNPQDPAVTDDTVDLTIRVNNIDEPGTVTVSDASPPTVNQRLAISVSDPDGIVGSPTSEWYRGDSATGPFTLIGSGSSPNGGYTPTADDRGKYLKVSATYHDRNALIAAHGALVISNRDPGRWLRTAENVISLAVAASQDTPANSPARGAPAISGTPQAGEILTASVSDIADDDGITNASFEYQWVRVDTEGDTDIADATASTYTVADSDVGKTLKVKVAFADDAGNRESLTSAATAAVAAAAGLEVESATVDGAALVLSYNEVLDSSVSLPVSAFVVTVGGQARSVESVSVSGTAVTLTLASAVAAGDRVTIAYTKPSGASFIRDTRGRTADSFTARAAANNTAASAVQRQTETTETVNSPASGAPAISGTPLVGQTLTAATSAISDADGLTEVTYSYSWIRNDGTSDAAIADATSATYTLADADAGKTIKVKVTFTDDDDNPESLTSEATAAVKQPLTAAMSAVQASHDGRSSFTFRLRLSEEPVTGFSYTTMRNHAFTVTGGSVTRARRVEPPGNVLWEITVAPSGTGDVTVTLPATSDCADSGAICTDDGRKLAGPVEETVTGPSQPQQAAEQQQQTQQQRTPLTAAMSGVQASHDGRSSFTFRLRLSEEPVTGFSYISMRYSAFRVTGGSVTRARRVEPPGNVLWEITIAPSGRGDITITLPVTTHCANNGAICTNDGRMLSTPVEATVEGPDT